MGTQIKKAEAISPEEFKKRAGAELKGLNGKRCRRKIGIELEVVLLEGLQRCPKAPEVIASAHLPLSPEAGRDCVELHTTPLNLDNGVLKKLEADLVLRLFQLEELLKRKNIGFVMHGLWPEYRQEAQEGNVEKTLYPNPRYHLLYQTLKDAKHPPYPKVNDIEPSLLEVAHTCSFQINISLSYEEVPEWFNASLFAMPLTLQLFLNSPFSLEKPGPLESRIPILEGCCVISGKKQCTFPKFMRNVHSYIEENIEELAAPLPISSEDHLGHLKIFLSTAWLWNRPKLYIKGKEYEYGIEIRHLPAGRSVKEMVAATALQLALTGYFLTYPLNYTTHQQLEYSFYAAVEGKLEEVVLPNGENYRWNSFLDKLPEIFRKGLKKIGIEGEEYWPIIQQIIENGSPAHTQLKHYAQGGIEEVKRNYLEYQRERLEREYREVVGK